MGDDAEQSRQHAEYAGHLPERSRQASSRRPTPSAPPWKCAPASSFPMQWAATQLNLGNALNNHRQARDRHGHARRGGRRPIATRSPSSRARSPRSTGPRRRTISARCCRRSASAPNSPSSRNRSPPSRPRWRYIRASACRSTGRWRSSISATSLQLAGKLEDDPAQLQEAVDAYREALSEYTPRRLTRCNGRWSDISARRAAVAGELTRSRPRTSMQSVQARRAALEVLTRDNAPIEWANAQNGIGTACSTSAISSTTGTLRPRRKAAFEASTAGLHAREPAAAMGLRLRTISATCTGRWPARRRQGRFREGDRALRNAKPGFPKPATRR